MNKFKKLFTTLISIAILTGCGSNPATTATPQADNKSVETQAADAVPTGTVKVGTLMGPTGMGLAKMMEDNETSKAYEFEILANPNDMVPKITNGELDIATIPSNLASVIFNKTDGAIEVVGINTLGVLYILQNGDTVNTVDDLKGKTIYSAGQGAVPEYVLNYILANNDMKVGEDVFVEYLPTHADVSARLITGEIEIGMLPEPNVTSAMMQNPEIRNIIDITSEWARITDENNLPMGVVVATKTFLDDNEEDYERFMLDYKASIDFVNNNDGAPALIEKFKIVPKAKIAELAIPNSNIVLITGDDMESNLKEFYEIVFEANPASIGGKLPSDEFYED